MLTATQKSPTRWNIDREGVVFTVTPTSVSSMKNVCKALDVTAEAVREAIAEAQKPEPVTPISMTVDGREVRGASPLECLRAAIQCEGEFVRWSDREQLCALDIDGVTYDETGIASLGMHCGADMAWLSRNRGGRLIFAEDEVNTGYEKACATAVLLDIAGCEFLNNTRVPEHGVAWDAINPVQNGLAYLIDYVERGEVEERDVESYLRERGWEKGRRYPHEECPIDPSTITGDDPVIPLDLGIYCYRCAGVSGRGFSFYPGKREAAPHPLITAAREWVHWGHLE